MAHFIGQEKPWTEGRDAHIGSTPYDQMVGTWWAVYDRHYKESVGEPEGDPGSQTEERQSVESSAQGASTIVHYHTKGEFQPVLPIQSSYQAHQPEVTTSEIFQPTAAEPPFHETTDIPRDVEVAYVPPVQTNVETYHEPPPEPHHETYHEPPKEPEVQYSAWDAARYGQNNPVRCTSLTIT